MEIQEQKQMEEIYTCMRCGSLDININTSLCTECFETVMNEYYKEESE